MVMATPVYRECKLGRGTVTEYRGCVIDPFEGEFGDILKSLFGTRNQCSCQLTCKLKEQANED